MLHPKTSLNPCKEHLPLSFHGFIVRRDPINSKPDFLLKGLPSMIDPSNWFDRDRGLHDVYAWEASQVTTTSFSPTFVSLSTASQCSPEARWDPWYNCHCMVHSPSLMCLPLLPNPLPIARFGPSRSQHWLSSSSSLRMSQPLERG